MNLTLLNAAEPTALSYWIFAGVAFFFYWCVRSEDQNPLLLLFSYVFYLSLDWRFGLVLAFVTVSNYATALCLERVSSKQRRRAIFFLGLSLNIICLCVFKYANFFVTQASIFLSKVGLGEPLSLPLFLPIGISFYLFQATGYLADVYRKSISAERSFLLFALFMSFFPQLIAGPIERAKKLLPQLRQSRGFEYEQVLQGVCLVLFGSFLKLVIADRMAHVVSTGLNEANLGIGAIAISGVFCIQLYFDFFSYTCIARGLAKMFGIELSRNFNHPFIASTPAEFWRRWHMTLSNWVRDYVYFPLMAQFGRKRPHRFSVYRAQALALFLIGVWHGASWNFVVYGVLWAFVSIVYSELGYWRKQIHLNLNGRLRLFLVPLMENFIKRLGLFATLLLAGLLFRSENLSQFSKLIGGIADDLSGLFLWRIPSLHFANAFLFAVTVLVLVDLFWAYRDKLWARFRSVPAPLRWVSYAGACTLLAVLKPAKEKGFEYLAF